jgi:polyhydroxyalkanoate synthesis regulator phasin
MATELLKKVLYTGVGAVTTTSDRVKKSIEELSKKGEDTQMEGKKVVDGFYSDVKERRELMGQRFRKVVDTVLGQFDFPNRTEAEKLHAKLAELEEKLAAQNKPARKTPVKKVVKKVVKKAVAKKTTTTKDTEAKTDNTLA